MEKKELIEILEPCKSAVDFYQYHDEIIKHLKGKEAKK